MKIEEYLKKLRPELLVRPATAYETMILNLHNENIDLVEQRNELLETLKVISTMSLSRMRQYCIDKKIHQGIANMNAALISQRIALATIAKYEKGTENESD